MLTLNQFSYHLPKENIAQTPAEPRDHSRLLRVDRQTGELSHFHYYDLPKLLTPNTVIVRNNTKVIPARILGRKTTGGQVEILLTKRVSAAASSHPNSELGEIWECLTKPGLKPNQEVIFERSSLIARCTAITNYSREITFNQAGHQLFTELHAIGHTPIPPYILGWTDDDEPALRKRYQTTYAKHQGSAAAPTAGLHFTPELDQQLLAKGVHIEEVTLHVGLGTFLKVKTDDITHHTMHQEWYSLDEATATRLNQAKQAGKKIVAVGTTTIRVLESCADPDTHALKPATGETSIFIYPPYQFRFVDHLLTNFHESQSTLLMLVSAFATQPNTNQPFTSFAETTVGQAYETAIQKKYRLLSFGDGMFIV